MRQSESNIHAYPPPPPSPEKKQQQQPTLQLYTLKADRRLPHSTKSKIFFVLSSLKNTVFLVWLKRISIFWVELIACLSVFGILKQFYVVLRCFLRPKGIGSIKYISF